MNNPFHLRTLLALLLAGTIAYSCGDDDGSEGPDGNFDREGMLNQIGASLIVPGYQALEQDMDALDAATEDFLNNPSTDNLSTVRDAFSSAYLSWQRVSPYEFGPADQVSFRSTVNNFPVDTSKVEDNITNGNFNLDVLSNNDAKGFPAIDYLLFEPGLNDAQVADRFDTDPNAANRGTYLSTIVDNIASLAKTVSNSWTPSGGNYLATFSANTGTDVGSSLGLLVNGFNLHYERNLRDGKIGIPVGVRSLGIAQPERSEAFYSGLSLDLAIANMNTIENIYLGRSNDNVDGLGFDDYLNALGATSLVNDTKAQMDVVQAALEGLPDPLSATIENNQGTVEQVYQEMQQLIILFKVDMPSQLGILITYQDNDGD